MSTPPGGTPNAEHDRALRPKKLIDFIGQRKVAQNLTLAITAAMQRSEPPDHILLSGPPGLGKTTLAAIVASELGVGFLDTAASLLEKPGDLAGILSGLHRGDILFIDEVHGLNKQVEEYLYTAMEDFKITVHLNNGEMTQAINMNLNPFTLIGATTREGLLSGPFRSRFGIRERLNLYHPDEMVQILRRTAGRLEFDADDEALGMVAGRCRGTPRIANNILRRLRDVAQIEGDGRLIANLAERGLTMLGIDSRGLSEMDRRIIVCLAKAGRPVGIKTVAMAVGEEPQTVEDAYEPYLIQCGLIQKTPQGRQLTSGGKEYAKDAGLYTVGNVGRDLFSC